MDPRDAFTWYPIARLSRVNCSLEFDGEHVTITGLGGHPPKLVTVALPELVIRQLTYISIHSMEQLRQWINQAAERAAGLVPPLPGGTPGPPAP